MDNEQYGMAKASLVFSMQEGYSWQTAAASAGLRVSRMPIGYGEPSDSMARRHSPKDDMVIRANCVEQYELFP